MAVRLTPLDKRAKFATRRRNELGANIWAMRYSGVKLALNPKVESLGEGSRKRQDLQGLFFEQYAASIGRFVQKEQRQIVDAAFNIGATWQMSQDNGRTWFDVFQLRIPKQSPMWYECTFARFISNANLTVTYDEGQGTYGTVEGNQVEDTVAATFSALVNQTQRPTDLDLPGTPAASIYLEGYHVSPTTAPTLNKQQRLFATLNGVVGEFVMLPTVQPVSGSNAGSGDLVKGVFVVKGV